MSQPDANQIFASLQQFLNERFDLEPTGLTREATLRSVGLDSMMVLDVMLEVEDRLGVKLDDMSLPKAERRRLQVVDAPKKSADAKLIKIADKISNIGARFTLIRRRRSATIWSTCES